MKRILITGASGLIGRHCLQPLIAHGLEVHAADLKIPEEGKAGVNWHQTNLLDPRQVLELISSVEPIHLLHCAWFTEPSQYRDSLKNIQWVQASLYLLEKFRGYGGQRIVMVGSCAEYDWQYGYCSETITPLAPTSLYGVCKHSLQLLLTAFSRKTGLSAAWGRVFSLYGPYEHPDRLVPSVINSLLHGQPARCTHGNQIRDFLFVEDAASALIALLESNVSGPVNIASGYPVVLKKLVNKIGEKLQQPDRIQMGVVPTPPGDPPSIIANVSRLSEEVGWQPRYDLDTGLEKTIRWWKNNAPRR